jgi:hypothetical protein
MELHQKLETMHELLSVVTATDVPLWVKQSVLHVTKFVKGMNQIQATDDIINKINSDVDKIIAELHGIYYWRKSTKSLNMGADLGYEDGEEIFGE